MLIACPYFNASDLIHSETPSRRKHTTVENTLETGFKHETLEIVGLNNHPHIIERENQF